MALPSPLVTPVNHESAKDKEEVSELVEELEEEYMLPDLEDVNFHGAALPANCPYTLSGLDTMNPTLTLGDGVLKLIGEYEYTIPECLVFTEHDEEAPGKSPVRTSEASSAPGPSQDKKRKINNVCRLQKKLKFRIMNVTTEKEKNEVPVRDTSNQTIVPLTRTTNFVGERFAQPLFSQSASGYSIKVTQNDTEAPQAAEIISRNDITSDTNGKLPASCKCVEGHMRHRIQGVPGGLCVALVGLFGLVVGLCWYWFGPSHATCTRGSVVECTGHVVDGMTIFPSAWQAVIAIVTGIASARLVLVVVNRRLASTSGASIAELEIGAQDLGALLSYRCLSIVNWQTGLLPLAGIILVHVAMHAAQVYSSSGMVAKTVFVGATADVGNSYSTLAQRRRAEAPIYLSYYLSAPVSVSQCFTCVNVGYDSLTYIRNVSMAAPPLNAYQSALGVEVAISIQGSSGGDERLFGCPENTRVFINSSGLGDGKVDLTFSGSTCGLSFWWQVQVVAQELVVGISVPSIVLTTEGAPAGQLTVLGSRPTGKGIGDIELQNLVTAMQAFNVTSVDPSLIAMIGLGLSDGTTLNSLVVSWVAASLSVIPAPRPASVWTAIKPNVPVMMPGACIAMSSVGGLLVLSAALELYLRVGCPHNIHSLTLGQACAADGTEGHSGCNDGGAHCHALETSRWRLGVQSGRHLSVEQGELAVVDPTVKYARRLKIT